MVWVSSDLEREVGWVDVYNGLGLVYIKENWVGYLFDSRMCRCCLVSGCLRVGLPQYRWMGWVYIGVYLEVGELWVQDFGEGDIVRFS